MELHSTTEECKEGYYLQWMRSVSFEVSLSCFVTIVLENWSVQTTPTLLVDLSGAEHVSGERNETQMWATLVLWCHCKEKMIFDPPWFCLFFFMLQLLYMDWHRSLYQSVLSRETDLMQDLKISKNLEDCLQWLPVESGLEEGKRAVHVLGTKVWSSLQCPVGI